MPAYAALLRAVNLGPHNKVSKRVLLDTAAACGFTDAQTYIASGNLVFVAKAAEGLVKAALEKRLAEAMGKPFGVMVRTAAELAAIRDANPFPTAPGNRVVAILLDAPPSPDTLEHARHVDGEEMALGVREIYVRYTDDGMGQSKLVIPAAKTGTARNMNTIAKLAEMAG